MIVKNRHTFDRNGKFSNEKNIEVYKDTLLKATQYPHGVTLQQTHDELIKLWKGPTFSFFDLKIKKKGEIVVENIDSVSAIVKYSSTKCAVLNMASAKRPGGGVSKGAKAQEEALFRCSNLGMSISNSHYPLRSDTSLYTKDVVFFKDVNYNDLSDGYLADVITCAAINLNDNAIYGYSGKDISFTTPSELSDLDYVQTTKNKVQDIIVSAVLGYIDTLILGAWGCGVFKNDPAFIATCFKELLENDGLKYYFDKVVFAVINDHNSVANNYEIFKKHLS